MPEIHYHSGLIEMMESGYCPGNCPEIQRLWTQRNPPCVYRSFCFYPAVSAASLVGSATIEVWPQYLFNHIIYPLLTVWSIIIDICQLFWLFKAISCWFICWGRSICCYWFMYIDSRWYLSLINCHTLLTRHCLPLMVIRSSAVSWLLTIHMPRNDHCKCHTGLWFILMIITCCHTCHYYHIGYIEWLSIVNY